ncbi:hypothetical protein SEA_WEST99_39 [Mycobacterium phage West99]|uniref:Uncharacterized protein n=1 Tax=Mycobacterium phage West99 TaxID=2652897 RepID=A0A5P8DB53_9CAUD|nr:hypothetical protein SEA_WEST99_39 [Mycobacterium phage West99]
MTHPDHFAVVGDALAPQPWMQLRSVATAETAGVAKSYEVSGGLAKNEAVLSLSTRWTNNSPVPQWVYGMVSNEGNAVYLQARSRAYLLERHGFVVDDDPAGVTMVDVSKCGTGFDIGKAGTLSLGTAFGISEYRAHSGTYPLMPQMTGMTLVAPGETFQARVELRFVSEYWEATTIDGGETGSESGYVAGGYRVDLFAVPALTPPGPRPVPTLVGGGSVSYDTQTSSTTEVEVPEDVEEGDMLVAVVGNQLGLAGGIAPVEAGWTRLLVVNDGQFGFADAHLKVYIRRAGSDEPDTYSFTNNLLAQQIACLFAVRDAAENVEEGWRAASALRRQFWERAEGHVAPSIDARGQLLVCVSYFAKPVLAPDITQTPPEDMSELVDIAKSASSMAIAYLESPPQPTGERAFTLSQEPLGVLGSLPNRTITATILIPGAYGS